MKYRLECPRCQHHPAHITRELISTEFETVCEDCNFYENKDKFLVPIEPLLDLAPGTWITDGTRDWQWVGPMMGTKGCWEIRK